MKFFDDRAKALLARSAPFIVFTLMYAYLLWSSAPHLYWGDSAEMVSVTCDLGVAHSTGYPIYTMAARLFGALPLSPYPFRINYMDVLLVALASTMFFLCAFELAGKSILAGVITILGLLGCLEFISYGLFAEVYPLHIFLFAAASLAVIRHYLSGEDKFLLFAVFIVGVGIAHHLLMVFTLFALIIYMIIAPGHKWRIASALPLLSLAGLLYALFKSHQTSDEVMLIATVSIAALAAVYLIYFAILILLKKFKIHDLAISFAVAFLVFAPTFLYAYLPLASARGPVGNWWEPHSLENFFNLILVQGYVSTVPKSAAEWLGRLNMMSIFFQTPVTILVSAAVGLLFLLWRTTRAGIFLLFVAAGTFVGSMIVTHGKPDALRLPLYACAYIAAGVAAGRLVELHFIKKPLIAWIIRTPLIVGAFIIVGLNMTGKNKSYMNHSRAAYELGANIIDSVRARSILFIGEQSPSILQYFETCEPDRVKTKDVAIVPVSFLPFKWKLEELRKKYNDTVFPDPPAGWNDRPVFSLNDPIRTRYITAIIENNPKRDALYSDFQMKIDDNNIESIPSGAVYQLLSMDTVSEDRLHEMARADKPPEWTLFATQDLITSANVASVHNERGKVYLEFALRNDDETMIKKAMKEFDLAIGYDKNSAEAIANKGQCKVFIGKPKEGMADMEKALKMDEKNPLMHEMLATFYFNIQSPDAEEKAIQHWAIVTALEPGNPRPFLNIGSAMVGLRKREAAIAYYRKAIELDPGYKDAYINLARVYNKMDICSQAVDTLEKVRDIYPRDIQVRSELAQQYGDCEMQHLFAKEIESMLADYPHDVKLYYNLAIIFSRGMQSNNMVKAIREVRKLDPAFPIRRFFASLQDCGPARTLITDVLKQMPDEVDLYLDLAMRHYNCDQPDKGNEVMAEAAKRFPNNGAVQLLHESLSNSWSRELFSEKINEYMKTHKDLK